MASSIGEAPPCDPRSTARVFSSRSRYHLSLPLFNYSFCEAQTNSSACLFDPTGPPMRCAGASAFFDLPVKRDVTAPFELRARAKATPTTTPRNCSFFLSRVRAQRNHCEPSNVRSTFETKKLTDKGSQTRARDRIFFATREARVRACWWTPEPAGFADPTCRTAVT
jgi:hypothetical protein